MRKAYLAILMACSLLLAAFNGGFKAMHGAGRGRQLYLRRLRAL